MKRILILPLFLVGSYFVAQDVEVVWSKEQNVDILYARKDGSPIVVPEKYAKTLAQKASKYGVVGDVYTQEYFFVTPKHHYKVYKSTNKVTKTLDTYFFEIGENAEIIDAPKISCSHPYQYKPVQFPGEINNTIGAEGVYQSEDKKMFAQVSVSSATALKGPRKIHLFVFDEDLHVLWEREQEFPFTNEESDFLPVRLTNDGKIILIARINKKKYKFDEELPYTQRLCILDKKGFKELDFELPSQSNPITLLTGEAGEDEIFLAGLYNRSSDMKKGLKFETLYSGFYTARLNCKNATLTSGTLKQIHDLGFSSMVPDELIKANGENWMVVAREYAESGSSNPYPDKGVLVLDGNGKVIRKTPIAVNHKALEHSSGTFTCKFNDKIVVIYETTSDKKKYEARAAFFDLSGKLLSNQPIPIEIGHRGDYLWTGACKKISDKKIFLAHPAGWGLLTIK